MPIDTDLYSRRLRARAIITSERKILIARLTGSEQEKDLTAPANCGGYGRIRHFRYQRYEDWSPNPLPIYPAAAALGRAPTEELRAQVFQNAACNWRCWYCFVDNDRLSANLRVARYFTAGELVDLYLSEEDRPSVLDLTGGQPDLVPEWIYWTMEALENRELAGRVFLWSDDNLSNWHFRDYLTPSQRAYMAQFPCYSRVGCFKGYDEQSFAFNTLAAPELFDRQFDIFRDLVREGFDVYAYVTFTGEPTQDMSSRLGRFVDRLQGIYEQLPLRTVPLRIDAFTPTLTRMKERQCAALAFQHDVHAAWVEELRRRFTDRDRAIPIHQVPLRS